MKQGVRQFHHVSLYHGIAPEAFTKAPAKMTQQELSNVLRIPVRQISASGPDLDTFVKGFVKGL